MLSLLSLLSWCSRDTIENARLRVGEVGDMANSARRAIRNMSNREVSTLSVINPELIAYSYCSRSSLMTPVLLGEHSRCDVSQRAGSCAVADLATYSRIPCLVASRTMQICLQVQQRLVVICVAILLVVAISAVLYFSFKSAPAT